MRGICLSRIPSDPNGSVPFNDDLQRKKEARGLTKLGFEETIEPPEYKRRYSFIHLPFAPMVSLAKIGGIRDGITEGAFRRCILLPAGGEKGRGQSYFYLVLHHSMDTLRKFLSRIQQILIEGKIN